MRKVLVLTEATYLNTGYAADGREILAGLQKTGKYDIAEFSIYGTPDDHRRSSIPWKNYANAPSDNDPDEIKNSYHSNPINQFGAWRFERVCLDFKPDVTCFPEGATVTTINGEKNIEDIKVGELVLTHKKRFMPVVRTMKRLYSDELIEFDIQEVGSVRLTPDHPILVYDNGLTNEPKFIPASYVRINDLVINKKHIPVKVTDKSHTEYRGYVYNIEVEEDNSYVSKICVHNCDIRDFWMCSFAKQSPYRKFFNWIYKSTIDAIPQNSEWINTFSNADRFLTITDWAGSVIKEQSDQKNLFGTATICAPRDFTPVPKIAHKLSMGLNPNWRIIGTVMRNQRRKLFPELFEAFGLYLKSSGDTQTYLYCHTSYPDNGWDIPQLLVKEGISSRVLFSYTCPCGKLTIAPFADALQQCRKCKNFSAKPVNVTVGASLEQLKNIYRCFDLYIQCANSEGLGIGVVEAAACGVPVMAVDYSAMSETSRKCGGYPIPVENYNLELETGCYRAKPNIRSIVDYWKHFFNLSESEREELSSHTFASYKANYNWDNVVKVWEDAIDGVKPKRWDIPPRLVQTPPEAPQGLTNKQFLEWAIKSYLPFSDLENSFEFTCLLRDLNFGAYRNNPCGYFYSENSYFDRVNFSTFSREDIIRIFKQKMEEFNFWEKARVGQIQFKRENWLA